MNKTVNINLAGVFFHIDEDAYAKLLQYLDAIKTSLRNTSGYEEIIADIEARIAELFNEKIKDKRQVVSFKEVEEVIAIMGQPEDYRIDEEMFEDEPHHHHKTTSNQVPKKLFRDTEDSYIGGVSSGLGHYVNIDAIWIRLFWILFTILSSGAFILIYIVFWIFVPEAKTTADKLAMHGEEVTISNIEKKIREGFGNVSGKMKDVDYAHYSKYAKSGAGSVGRVISGFFKVLVKLFGIFILFLASIFILSLFAALFTVGSFGIIDAPWTDYIEMAVSGAPFWVILLTSFFFVGIPLFFLFILGLKLVFHNLKSIGRTAKLVLLGVWILSLFAAIFIGIRQNTNRAFDGENLVSKNLPIAANDTLYLAMNTNPDYSTKLNQSSDFKIKYDENDQKILYFSDINLKVKSTKDSLAHIEILKSAEGKNFKNARQSAQNINYKMLFTNNNQLLLDGYFTTPAANKYHYQKVKITLYLPIGSVLFTKEKTDYFYSYQSENIINGYSGEHYLKILENAVQCEDCAIQEINEEHSGNEDQWNEESDYRNRKKKANKVKIDQDGISIQSEDGDSIMIDRNGIQIHENK